MSEPIGLARTAHGKFTMCSPVNLPTPATSHPTAGGSVKESQSRPATAESEHNFSSARDADDAEEEEQSRLVDEEVDFKIKRQPLDESHVEGSAYRPDSPSVVAKDLQDQRVKKRSESQLTNAEDALDYDALKEVKETPHKDRKSKGSLYSQSARSRDILTSGMSKVSSMSNSGDIFPDLADVIKASAKKKGGKQASQYRKNSLHLQHLRKTAHVPSVLEKSIALETGVDQEEALGIAPHEPSEELGEECNPPTRQDTRGLKMPADRGRKRKGARAMGGNRDGIDREAGSPGTKLNGTAHSLVPSVKKRKAEAEHHEVEPIEDFPSKQRLRTSAKTAPTVDRLKEDEELPPPKKRGRPKKSAPMLADGQDEITVAKAIKTPKPSLQLVIPVSTREAKSALTSTPSWALTGRKPKLLMSCSQLSDPAQKWVESQGCVAMKDVPARRTHYVCVTEVGKLHTTAKLLRSLALGKLVVTDKWVLDSRLSGELLSPDDYVHPELADTVEIDRRQLFAGKTLFYTAALKSLYRDGWASVRALAKEVGAKNVLSRSARQAEGLPKDCSALFLGAENDDPDVLKLMRDDRIVYHKDLLTQSVLRGELVLEGDEFVLELPISSAKKGKEGR